MYEEDIEMQGTVKSVALGKTQTGKVQLAVTFSTDSPEHPSVTRYLFFTDKALPYTEADLRTLGWDPIQNRWGLDDMLASDAIVGAQCDLVCAMEEYEGKARLKVKFINERGGGAGLKDKMDEDETRRFTMALRQQLGVTGGAAKKKATKPQPVAAGRGSEEDVPF